VKGSGMGAWGLVNAGLVLEIKVPRTPPTPASPLGNRSRPVFKAASRPSLENYSEAPHHHPNYGSSRAYPPYLHPCPCPSPLPSNLPCPFPLHPCAHTCPVETNCSGSHASQGPSSRRERGSEAEPNESMPPLRRSDSMRTYKKRDKERWGVSFKRGWAQNAAPNKEA
jgi:hypothetical protein